ncbi:protein serine/threonine phosphatase 2C [Aaosphaeria arxii CBS 175.79]|uniref:Protein serine/threonine phosphatase 2C n=1 Tax=Aaosphaeria arxii CBS 175.79 TaxID=1450172 RepID=A0A6A5XWG9_9PLEO|nr:protein serine/threonine phosphatase 2C [Aaosphaeria arxii CBS 175.79]KAF2017512.1 protein serine/threonine phosphatase 2C [Aaosphaeria arxii CBS 175.79]
MVRQPRFQEVADLAFPFLAGGWSVGSRGLREDTLALERAVEGGERVVVEVGGKKGGKVGEGSWWEKGRGEREESGLPETHGCRWRSNDPCEDYFAFGTSPGVGGKPWNYWGVYDGHAGSQTSFWLQKTLIPHVSLSLCYLDELSGPDAITKNISQTFLNADDYLMSQAKKAVSWSPPASPIGCRDVENAMAGSCALLSMFDPQTSKLRVACVGDSRAVLGRWDPVEQKYVCMPLSTDQTGFNKDEVSRIQAEHPEEDDILDPDSGRLLGLAVTRAFGDHRWKWPNDLVTKAQTNHFGTAPRPKSRTPPYLTAEPVITETDIIRHPASSQSSASPAHTPRSDFMILASDGLWDRISSADAVALVSSWLTARSQGAGFVRDNPSAPSPPQYPIPDVLESGVTVTDGEVQWRAEPAYFSVEDENAAVCLARNALGGTRKNLFHGLVQRDAPWVRNAVDDTTVIVVFFDEDSEIPAKGKGKERVEVEGIRPGLLEQFEKKEKRWWWPF